MKKFNETRRELETLHETGECMIWFREYLCAGAYQMHQICVGEDERFFRIFFPVAAEEFPQLLRRKT